MSVLRNIAQAFLRDLVQTVRSFSIEGFGQVLTVGVDCDTFLMAELRAVQTESGLQSEIVELGWMQFVRRIAGGFRGPDRAGLKGSQLFLE